MFSHVSIFACVKSHTRDRVTCYVYRGWKAYVFWIMRNGQYFAKNQQFHQRQTGRGSPIYV